MSAPTDAGSLARPLNQSDVVESAVIELDRLVPALARNVEYRKILIERAGRILSAEDAGRVIACRSAGERLAISCLPI
ncbi:hypothetical protein X772_24220 [Mesorhizobium sp. LSJC280B00]|nr:hypothetical protein X772_24220 [Mesorhizobium sp. LSJC280B00]